MRRAPSSYVTLCFGGGLLMGLQGRVSRHGQHPAPSVLVPTEVQSGQRKCVGVEDDSK